MIESIAAGIIMVIEGVIKALENSGASSEDIEKGIASAFEQVKKNKKSVEDREKSDWAIVNGTKPE